MIVSLNPYRTKTILTILEKDINRKTISPIIQRPFTHTKAHHSPLSFSQTSLGGTPTQTFSIRLLPFELSQWGFLKHGK